MTAMNQPLTPQTPLSSVLDQKSAATLEKKLEITTAGQLLEYFPRKWIDHGRLSSFADLVAEEHATVIARVRTSELRRMQRRRGSLLEVLAEDESGGQITMAFFQGWAAQRELKAGATAMFHGKVSTYRNQLTLTNPEFSVLGEEAEEDQAAADLTALPAAGDKAPMPIYPAKAGLSSWSIYRMMRMVLRHPAAEDWPDPLPEEILSERGLLHRFDALRHVHMPLSAEDPERGMERLRYEEAFMVQALLRTRRDDASRDPGQPRPLRPGGLLESFDETLPYTLTPGQLSCGELLAAELAQPAPMNRLLQGEVGSGKTLVALRAMLQVVDAGGQAVLIAPTEVLAAQHERSLRRMLGSLVRNGMFAGAGMLGGQEHGDASSCALTLLTGSLKTSERRRALLEIASGEAGIVVGTHAVLSDQVTFADLGLVVIDEQHRFGVEQRNALRSRPGTTPHMLVMSATPIPRSVAMTVFGDLQLTVLEGLPAHRQPIQTHLARMALGPRQIGRVWERIAEEVREGRQAYVVCPKITQEDVRSDPGSGVSVEQDASVELMAQTLAQHPLLGSVRLGSLHGRMDSEATEDTMRSFERGEIDVLISTTVIEVGVDVPNATVMAILDADAFGISTLHQLRGRVGRGEHPGLCLLVTRLPEEHPSMPRLIEVSETLDGLELARRDVARRREGDVLGASQAGKSSSLSLLRAIRDEAVIIQAAEDLHQLAQQDPEWSREPALNAELREWTARHDEAEEFIQRG